MTTFIIIVLVLLVVGYFFSKKSSTKPQVTATPKPIRQAPKIERSTSEKKLYKKKSIREFDIVGSYHLKLDPNKIIGGFIGYAACTRNAHDKFAVGIYNDKGIHIGYVPKGNNILHDSLKECYEGKVVAWGDLSYDTFEKGKWYGKVYIPVKYTKEEILKFEEFLELRDLNAEQMKKGKENTTKEYIQILERHKKINKNLQLKIPDTPFYYFPKNFLPSVSKHLEKQKKWDKLIELESYEDLMNDLSDKYKATTVRRIELAKTHMST